MIRRTPVFPRFARTIGVGLLLASSVVLAPKAAFAGDAVIAESMYQEGVKLMKAGKFKDACPKLEESLRQDHAAGTLLALADCNEKIGKNASAWAQFKELSFELKKRNKLDMAQQAADRANGLEAKLSKLTINAAGDTPGLVIVRDKEEIGKAILGTPIAIDPGEHVIAVTAPGFQVWQTTIVIGPTADMQTVAIPPLVRVPKAAKAGPNKGLLYAGIGIGVVGVAGLAVGGAFGGLAMSQASGTKTNATLCPNSTCTPAGRSAIDAATTKATISTIGLAAGGVLAVTGIVLIAVSGPSKKDDAKATADSAPARVQIQAFGPTIGPQGGGFAMMGAF